MIIYDFMGHMVSTVGPEELHAYAKLLGLLREWYQTPAVSRKTGKCAKIGPEYAAHYDLTTPRMRAKAGRMGATLVDPMELAKKAWWAEDSRIEKQEGGDQPN